MTEVKLLEYKPSIIVASTLLSASYQLLPLQFPSFKASILSCKYMKKVSTNLLYNFFFLLLSTKVVGCRRT